MSGEWKLQWKKIYQKKMSLPGNRTGTTEPTRLDRAGKTWSVTTLREDRTGLVY